MTPIPQRVPLRRQWTGSKLIHLARLRNVDIGKNILRNVIFTCNPKSIAEIITEADQRALLHGFTHPTGARPHRSTVAIHNGKLMERRVYFNNWKIEWIPI